MSEADFVAIPDGVEILKGDTLGLGGDVVFISSEPIPADPLIELPFGWTGGTVVGLALQIVEGQFVAAAEIFDALPGSRQAAELAAEGWRRFAKVTGIALVVVDASQQDTWEGKVSTFLQGSADLAITGIPTAVVGSAASSVGTPLVGVGAGIATSLAVEGIYNDSIVQDAIHSIIDAYVGGVFDLFGASPDAQEFQIELGIGEFLTDSLVAGSADFSEVLEELNVTSIDGQINGFSRLVSESNELVLTDGATAFEDEFGNVTVSEFEYKRAGDGTITYKGVSTNPDRPDLPPLRIEISKPETFIPDSLELLPTELDLIDVTIGDQLLTTQEKSDISVALAPTLRALNGILDPSGLQDGDRLTGIIRQTDEGDLVLGLTDETGREGYSVISGAPGAGLSVDQRVINDGDVTLLEDVATGETQVLVTKEQVVDVVDEQGNVTGQRLERVPVTISAQQIGSIFGSQIGRAIAGDDPFAQVAVSAALQTVLFNVGEVLDVVLFDEGGQALSNIDLALEDLPQELVSNLQAAGIGALSSYLAGKWGQGKWGQR